MSGEEAASRLPAKCRSRTGHNLGFCAAHIREQEFVREAKARGF